MNSAKKKGVNSNQLYTSLKRGDSDHNSLKKSAIVAALRSRGETPQSISDKSGICIAQVYNYLKINVMPEKIKKFIQEGRIPATDILSLKRNQPTEEAFVEEVERYIQMKESDQLRYMDTNMTKKEQSFTKRGVAPEKQHKLFSDLEKLFKQYSPVRVTKTKINMAANVINTLMAS